MKILFYITSYPGYGGIETVTTVLANWFAEHGVVCSILSYWNRTPFLLSKLSVRVNVSFTPDGGENQVYVTEKNKAFVKDFCTAGDFDYIIYQDCYSPIHKNIQDILPSLRAKFIVVEHNTPLCYLIGYKLYWQKLRWLSIRGFFRKLIYPYKIYNIKKNTTNRHNELLNICDKYILLSEQFKPQLLRLCGDKNALKVGAISNPLTLSFQSNNMPKKKQVLWIGRVTRDKGYEFISRIWKIIEEKHPDWLLVVVGDGENLPELKKSIEKERLERVRFDGYQSNVEHYYEESSILMMTSYFEGFGLVLVEAMSRGCVPLAFNSFPSLVDIIDDGIDGYAIPKYDVKMYSRTLLNLISDEKQRNLMSQKAIVKSDFFNISTIANQWIQVLK